MSQATLLPGPELDDEGLARAVALLATVRPADRVLVARDQLTKAFPDLVKQFERIPRNLLGRTVLFLSLRPQHAREPTLGIAARLAGWNPVLVYRGKPTSDLAGVFSSHIQVDGILALLLVGWLFPGPIVHLFAEHGAQAHPFCILKHRRTVIDLFDTCSGMRWMSAATAQKEREAMAAADGMTHRDLRAHYLRKDHGYRLPRQNVFVLDPVTLSTAAARSRAADGEIRVVASGWTGDSDTSILQMVQSFCAGGVHVHLYPFPPGTPPEAYRRLQLLFPSHFHLEEPAFGAAYREQLTRYDFGLTPCERHIFGEPATRYSVDYLRGCGSSRLMDFIQAGLGIIVSPDRRFQFACARRYAIATVTADIDLLRRPKEMLTAALCRRRLTAADLSSITVQRLASRLNGFYLRVSGHPAPSPA